MVDPCPLSAYLLSFWERSMSISNHCLRLIYIDLNIRYCILYNYTSIKQFDRKGPQNIIKYVKELSKSSFILTQFQIGLLFVEFQNLFIPFTIKYYINLNLWKMVFLHTTERGTDFQSIRLQQFEAVSKQFSFRYSQKTATLL